MLHTSRMGLMGVICVNVRQEIREIFDGVWGAVGLSRTAKFANCGAFCCVASHDRGDIKRGGPHLVHPRER